MKRNFYLVRNGKFTIHLPLLFPGFLQAQKKTLLLTVSLLTIIAASFAQQTIVYDFASATVTVAPIGYNQPGAGTYYRAAGGGTITFGTSSCDGFSKSAPTGSSLFHFVATRDVKSITIRGMGTGSNRLLSAFATSATLGGTYVNVANTNTSTMTVSGSCGQIVVTPTTAIPAGTYMRFTLSGNIDVTSIVLNVVPVGTPPTIATVSIVPGKNSANINGDITPGTMPLDYSGVIWSTSNAPMDTSLATKTLNRPSATGPYTNTVTGLTPATSYFGRAYVVDLAGNVYYGAIVPFQTLAATIPSLTTVVPNNISSFQAFSGGTVTDSGGLNITQKGVCWSTSPNPTVALTTKTTQGANGNDFASTVRVLQPSTTYYVRAYAVNSVGIGYGIERTFTTLGAVPSLIANPTSLNFGAVSQGSAAPVFGYNLIGTNLAPAAGNISVTAPTGYTISTSPTTGFAASLVLPYSAGALASKIIYVKLSTASYGNYCGDILHSGGGAVAPNADTVKVCGSVVSDPSVTTNLGTDFWTGFGYQEKMSQKAYSSGEAKLSLYISVPTGSQQAVVNVDLPGVAGAAGFPRAGLTVAPGSVIEVKNFPTGDANSQFNPSKLSDVRLYYTGVSSRGIHIYSTNGVPISVWMHSYTDNNSAAGAMLFPTNTWNNAYTVQAYGGYSNTSNPNSYFFAIANEDNTPIWFTPGNDILDSSAATLFTDDHAAANVKYKKGVRYGPITLNKGQVFNAMGFILGNGSGTSSGNALGLDLSGSKVETTCDKKIAVFGGNGRCLINAAGCSAGSGSDHMIQQMFPSVAWGTKYLTVPTKTMEYNLFRINVSDPATQVWVNNAAHTTPLTGLINNLYYEISTKQATMIESNKPITVTQFIVAGDCAVQNGAKGAGDPEMIILSPVQQAINNATVYSATIKNAGATYNGHYINVVIKKGGVSSFRLDGAAVADTGINQATASTGTAYNTGGIIPIANAFVTHPGDNTYAYAKFKVAPGASHRISSDSNFNAIAYGMGDGESYGYSAGTNIKDLSKPLLLDNPYAPNDKNTTCKNNPVKMKAVLPYPPSQVSRIDWFMGQVAGLNRNDTALINPTPDSSYIQDGVTYYVYTNPNLYVFPVAGSFKITGLVTGTFASACGSTSPLDFTIIVGEGIFPDFSFNYNPCVSDSVKFTDLSDGLGFNITKWQWNFGDNKTDTVKNPSHVYTPTGIYTIKLRVISEIGCFADTVKIIDQTLNLTAKFGVPDTICAKAPVVFTDSSTATSPIVKWYWDFGDRIKDTLSATAPRTHVYNNPGTFVVTLTVQNAAGCKDTYTKTVTVRPAPFATFNMPAGICLPSGVTQFTNLSTISDNSQLAYNWTFGDAGVSTATNPIHTYTSTGPFTIQLTATSLYGCKKDTTRILSTVYAQPKAGFTTAPETCLRDTTSFTDTSNGQGNAVVKWYWNFGDNKIDSVKNPKHAYLAAGTYTVALVVTTDKGCVSDTFRTTIIVNTLPVANFTFSTVRCAQQPVTFTGQTGTGTITSWMWNLGNGTIKTLANNNPFTENYAAAGSYNATLVVVDNKGCKSDTVKKTVVINPNPVVGFTVANNCFGDPFTQFTDTSSIADGTQSQFTYAWTFGDANATPANPNTATIKNPKHTYPALGTYTVSLTVSSANTCATTITKAVTINPLPFVNFSVPASVCLPDGRAQFNDSSKISDGSEAQFKYSWSFGDPSDPTTSLSQNPIHRYSTTGPFNIKLTVTSKDGCVHDTTKTLSNVFPQPKAAFSAAPVAVCLGDAITFTDNSTSLPSPIKSWRWNFDDGKTDTLKNITYTYTKSGIFSVSLSVINTQGCVSDTARVPVTINALPVVDGGPTLFVLQGQSVTLQPIITGPAVSYKWTPSLYLDNDSIRNPVSKPNNDITYLLTVTGTGGCVDRDTARVALYRSPIIPNAFSPNGDGINDTWNIGYLDTYPKSVLEIFNRYGQILFTNRAYTKPWDGKVNGTPLPVGVYYYIINLNIGTPTISGSVTILR